MIVSFLSLALPAGALARECPDPAGSEPFEQVAPEAVGLDPAAVRDAIGFATTRNARSVRVYRHGCLAGVSVLDPLTEEVPNDVWSTTKGHVSLLTGRAVTLGLLDVDDRSARWRTVMARCAASTPGKSGR